MTFSVSNFKSALGSGTRANLFDITISIANTAFTTTSEFNSLAKASTLPASTVGLIEVPHLGGRKLKVAGDRTFAEWTVTLMSDSAFKLRTALEDYQSVLLTLSSESADTIGNRGILNRSTITVKQLADNGDTLRTYVLNDAFPTEISAIDLSYDTRDAIEEFTVTWAYDYYTVS